MRSLVGTDLALDPATGDLDFENGDLYLIEGLDAIRQHLRQRLSFGFAEWFLDITRGVPYIRDVFVKNPNIAVIEALFRNEILGTAGVTQLNSLSFGYDPINRTLSVVFNANTINGNLNFSELIEVV